MSEVIEYKGFKIKTVQDTSPESPRTSRDNFGTLVCFHRNYDLGDKDHGFADPEAVMAHIKATGAIYLPVYLYDHSILSLSVKDFQDEWDSGQVGVIFATPVNIRECFMVKGITARIRERAYTTLRCEVEEMNQYLSGDVWGYVITREVDSRCSSCGHSNNDEKEIEEVDSCWGYYGYEYCLQEAKRSVDAHIAYEAKQKHIKPNRDKLAGPPKNKVLDVIRRFLPKVGEPWQKDQWVYIRDGRWFQATGKPVNDDGTPLRREEDELSEAEANALGIFRPIVPKKNRKVARHA